MRVLAVLALGLAAAEAWQPSALAGARPIRTAFAAQRPTLAPRIIVAADALSTDGLGAEDVVCDPLNPEYCEPIAISAEDAAALKAAGLKRMIKLGGLFSLWYALNVAYNIGNKLVLTALPIPWTAATVELFFGLPYVLMLWATGLRKTPKLSFDDIKTLSSQGFFLAATHVGGVISFGAGAISFTHVLKATEPG
mmetsp:Transcript_8525/g.20519  ORF Transcript_8525/g.20519 Transcript_8525/m.20519 type:complete len:195 (-) Transcript_8525:17-601(-)